jgi:hypothetical protein
MAFTTLSNTLIQVGKAIKREIFTTLKDNQDDLNTRVVTLEGGANKVQIWGGVVTNASSASTLTGLAYWPAPATFTLLEVKCGIYEKGSLTGTLEIDILKSPDRDPANFVSVMTNRPSIPFASASDYDDSTDGVIDATKQTISQGDWLRLDVTSLPSNGVLGSFVIEVFGEIN